MRVFLSAYSGFTLAVPMNAVAAMMLYDKKTEKVIEYDQKNRNTYISLPRLFNLNEEEVHHGIILRAWNSTANKVVLLTAEIKRDIEIPDKEFHPLPKALGALRFSRVFNGIKFSDNPILLLDIEQMTQLIQEEQQTINEKSYSTEPPLSEEPPVEQPLSEPPPEQPPTEEPLSKEPLSEEPPPEQPPSEEPLPEEPPPEQPSPTVVSEPSPPPPEQPPPVASELEPLTDLLELSELPPEPPPPASEPSPSPSESECQIEQSTQIIQEEPQVIQVIEDPQIILVIEDPQIIQVIEDPPEELLIEEPPSAMTSEIEPLTDLLVLSEVP
jgi:hypothetical protein